MVTSKKGNKHNFLDYAYAVEVCKDFPALITLYDKIIGTLVPHQKYTGVAHVLHALYEAQSLMEIHLDYYNHIKKTKGLVTENESK